MLCLQICKNVKYVKWPSHFVTVAVEGGGGVVSNAVSYSSQRPVLLRYWSSLGWIDRRSWIRWFHQSPVDTSASPRIMTVSISIIVCGGAQTCINNSDNTPPPSKPSRVGVGRASSGWMWVRARDAPQLTGRTFKKPLTVLVFHQEGEKER